MNKIIVTGGYGFIASRLVLHFSKLGFEVIIIEHPESICPDHLKEYEVIKHDITSSNIIDDTRMNSCDVLLHLAAQSSGPRSFSIPSDDIKINILGTLNIIDNMKKYKIPRIIFASSFVIYGDKEGREIISEKDECLPKSVYAGSKLAAEHLLQNYAQPNGIKWNALRMFNVYGPGQDITKKDQGLVGIFMNMLLESNEVEVKGRLDRFRDLVYIDDVIQGWEACLNSGKANKAYNLGSGKKVQFAELIKNLAKALGKFDKLKITELPGSPGDMLGCIANIDSLKQDTSYNPKTEILEGIEKMYQSIMK